MKSSTLCRPAGLFLYLLFFISGKSQVVSVASGNWNSSSTWSTGSVPGPNDDVIIRHNVTISNSAFSATVNSLTLDNSTGNHTTLNFNSGSAVRNLHIRNNLTVTATTNNNCRFMLQGASTGAQVDGDIILTRDHTGFVDAFGLCLRSGSSMTATNLSLYYINSGDDHQEVYIRETSSLILSGNIFVESTGGAEEPSIDVVDDARLECNDLTMLLSLPEAPSGVGRDAELRIWENGQLIVHGNLLARRTGGRRISITIGDDAPASAVLLVEGNMTLEHLNGLNHTNKDMPLEVVDQSSVIVRGNLTAISNSARALNMNFYNNSQLDVDGLVTLTGSTNTNVTLNAYHTSRLYFGGDIVTNYPISPNPSAFFFASTSPNFSTVTFDGTGNQTVPAETYGNLVVNNISHVTLAGNITVNNHLDLANGKVIAATRVVTLPIAATIAGSSNSYICNGTLKRTLAAASESYWFYVGDTVKGYSPVTLSNISSNSTFEVTYYPINPGTAVAPGPYSTAEKVPLLQRVSHLEYWMIDRTAGSGSAQVGLGWNAQSGVTESSLDQLRIAHWDGARWTDTGPTVHTGSATSGMIRTVTDMPGFSPFTLASTGPDHFTVLSSTGVLVLHAKRQQSRVQLRWENPFASLEGTFVVERSEDGSHFERIGSVLVTAMHNRHTFSWTDIHPLPCNSYYRIFWQEDGGQTRYSNIVSAGMSFPAGVHIYPNPVTANASRMVTISLPDCSTTEYMLQVTDLAGRILRQIRIAPGNKQVKLYLPQSTYAKGIYLVHIRYTGGSYSKKILIE